MRQPFHRFGLKGERAPLQIPKLDNDCFVLRALYTVGQNKHDIKLLFFHQVPTCFGQQSRSTKEVNLLSIS